MNRKIFCIMLSAVMAVLILTSASYATDDGQTTEEPVVSTLNGTVSTVYATLKGTVQYSGTIDAFWFEFNISGETPEKISATLDADTQTYLITVGPLEPDSVYYVTACCKVGEKEYKGVTGTIHTPSAVMYRPTSVNWSMISPIDPSTLNSQSQMNMILLNSLLKNRSDTLTTLFSSAYLSDSFMKSYKNSAALKLFINFFDSCVYNLGGTVKNYVFYYPRELAYELSQSDANDVIATIGSDTEYNHFQAAINAALTGEYESSNKYSFGFEQANFQSLNNMNDTASRLKTVLEDISKYTDFGISCDDAYINYYNTEYLPKYRRLCLFQRT